MKSISMCAMALATLFMWVIQSAQAETTFTTLHNFDGTDGVEALAQLIQATDGNFYGTTGSGGANDVGGTVFKITPSGALTTLYSFCAQPFCTDGATPETVIQADNGNFYGTASDNGANDAGTIYKITPDGAFTTLYNFCSKGTYPACKDGYSPSAALIQAADGDFYGTTEYGGSRAGGTVYKITPSGKLTTLYSFCDAALNRCTNTNGSNPSALIQASDGDFYGTTLGGGPNGGGTVFKITTSGTLTTLYNFCSHGILPACTDGFSPVALLQAADGNFYGTTGFGGANSAVCGPLYCAGTVFKITPNGALTTLYSFCSQAACVDGNGPSGVLIQATNGDLYGTTAYGGGKGHDGDGGTVFRITPGGELTKLRSFGGVTGARPAGGLMQATNGDFYGTTTAGGANSDGTIFLLSVGLGAFVETQTTSGTVGAPVKILGTDLTGSTRVTFNGIAATFTVVAGSEITTTVPAGATTGYIDVVTPVGKLKSNVVYTVNP